MAYILKRFARICYPCSDDIASIKNLLVSMKTQELYIRVLWICEKGECSKQVEHVADTYTARVKMN